MFDKLKKLFTGDEEDLEIMSSSNQQIEEVVEEDELEQQGLVNLKETQTGVKDFFSEPKAKPVEVEPEPVVVEKPIVENRRIPEKKNTYRITEVISPIKGLKDGKKETPVSVRPDVVAKPSIVSELIRPISHNSNTVKTEEVVLEETSTETVVEQVTHNYVDPNLESILGNDNQDEIIDECIEEIVEQVNTPQMTLAAMLQDDHEVSSQPLSDDTDQKFNIFTDEQLASIKTESLNEFEENFDLFGHEVDVTEVLNEDEIK